MTDGGTVCVDEIAEKTDWSTSTIYRALRRLGGLLENGHVSFSSVKIRNRVRELPDPSVMQ